MSPREATLIYEALSDVQDRILIAMSRGTKELPLTKSEAKANRRLRDIAEYVDVKMAYVKPSHQRVTV